MCEPKGNVHQQNWERSKSQYTKMRTEVGRKHLEEVASHYTNSIYGTSLPPGIWQCPAELS